MIEVIKQNQRDSGLKNIITELKKILEEFNSRCKQVEDRISESEDNSLKIIMFVKKKRKIKVNSLRDTQDTIKQSNIHITEIPEEEKEKMSLFDTIMAEKFPNLRRKKDLQIQEVSMNSCQIKPKKSHVRILLVNF